MTSQTNLFLMTIRAYDKLKQRIHSCQNGADRLCPESFIIICLVLNVNWEK